MTVPSVELSWVQPGRAAQTWVRHAVGELKGRDPLAPVTLIVPNHYAGRQVREAVRRVGGVLTPLSHYRALHQALMLRIDLSPSPVNSDTRSPVLTS